MDNLEEFLSNEPEAVEAPEAAAETPVEVVETPAEPVEEAKPETAERPRGPDGKFISKAEATPVEAEAKPEPQEPQLDHAALLGERRRRQEAEQRIAEYEARLAELQKPAPQPAPDQWEDPEGHTRWLIEQARKEAAEAATQAAFETFQTQRIAMSAEEAKAKLPDYAEKMQVFEQMMQGNPQLLQELYRAPNPAEYAYNTAKTQIEINQYGGLDGLIAARVQDALKAQAPAAQPSQPPIPDSLASEQSARGSAVAYQPMSLEDLLKQ